MKDNCILDGLEWEKKFQVLIQQFHTKVELHDYCCKCHYLDSLDLSVQTTALIGDTKQISVLQRSRVASEQVVALSYNPEHWGKILCHKKLVFLLDDSV